MIKTLAVLLVTLMLSLSAAPFYEAMADGNSRDLAGALSRLQNNPRYQGRILGTHIKRNNGGYLYEIRILRRDDRIVLVYIDPETGGVVGDSVRRGVKNREKRRNPKRRKRK